MLSSTTRKTRNPPIDECRSMENRGRPSRKWDVMTENLQMKHACTQPRHSESGTLRAGGKKPGQKLPGIEPAEYA